MPLRISSEWTQLRRIKQVHRTKHSKNSSKMNGNYGIYRRSKRDSQSGPEQSTIVSVVYVTASPTFTGPIVGYMTLGPAVEKISGSDAATTSEMMSSAVNQTVSTSSASLQSSTVDELTSTSTFTSTSTATSSFATPSYSVSSISTSAIASSSSAISTPTQVITSSQIEQEQSVATQSAPATPATPLTTTIPLAMAIETPSPTPTSIATSLKDLPMVIESPTSTVPISMSLLVATSSSSSNTLLATTSIEEPIMATPNPPAISTVNTVNADPSTPKVSSNIGATGKASLIIGVVLLLGAVFMMLQVYLNKRRRSIVGEKLDDDEKGALKNMNTSSAMSPSVPPKLNLQTNSAQNKNPRSTLQNSSATGAKKLCSPTESPTANPFGKHAEILVDSTNARGPQVIDKVTPNFEESPVKLAPVASKKGQLPPGLHSSSTAARLPNLKIDSEAPVPTTGPTQNPNSSFRSTTEPNSPVNSVYRVQIDFSPSMDDELELRAGQLIRVLHEYDDGWAMCVRLDCSRQGVCPRTCLSARPVKPRSPSGGPRGPPPAINVPMTPTSRPQSGTKINGPSSPAVAHFSTTTPRSSQGHESNGFHTHGLQKANPSQDSFYPGQMQRVGNSQVSKGPEVPSPLVLFPRAPPEISSSRETPSAATNNHSSVHSLNEGHTSTSLPTNSSPSITSPPECPGPVAPAHDYFSLNKPVPAFPPQTDASAAQSGVPKAPMSPNVNQSNAEVGTSAHSSHQNFDHITDTSIPGQAL
ncbi:hypothetical protein K3495_g6367 [Podosphaera aphanis]|nr:hypothetical protein K3495_g6367 [Podosphaera aphanis]